MEIIVSIIIPTYKRKDSLVRLLGSLKTETKREYEIIVVEQGFHNGKFFTEFAKKSKIPLQYIFLNIPSTSHAKNVGVAHAKGRYIVFFDDDVVVEKGLVNAYVKDFEDDREKRIGGIAGRVLTPGHPIHEKSTNIGKISFWGKFSDEYSSLIPQEVDTVIGCNAAWRKDVFEKVGGFDEQFTGNAMREETDLSLRVKANGYHIMYEPEASVKHLREETGGNRKSEGRLQWYYHFFSNETYFFLKHRPWFVTPIILVTRWEWMVRCMFGFGREVSWRSMITPFAGIIDGVKKYQRYR